MTNFLVLASAHTADPDAWAGLRDTCALFGVPLRVLGIDKPLGYASNDPRLFLESVPDALEALRASDDEYVLLTDAFDVLACRKWNAGYVAGLIEDAPGKLLVSCEANCFPDGPWREVYDAASSSPWRYGNAGQYCGRREAVIELLAAIQRRIGVAVFLGGVTASIDAQIVIHCLYTQDGYPMAMDTECRVFQSLYLASLEAVPFQLPCRNAVTGTFPFFLHFNGRAPGMPEWYRSMTGKPLPPSSVRPEYA